MRLEKMIKIAGVGKLSASMALCLAMVVAASATLPAMAATTYTVRSVDSDELSGVTMTPEQQLVYAVTNAVAGDTVLVEPGRYTFTGDEYSAIDKNSVTNILQFPANNITIIGDTDSPRATWTDGAEPVIINANGKGRLFNCDKSGCSIRNVVMEGCVGTGSGYAALLATGSSSVGISNCVVRGAASGLWSCAIWSNAVMHDSTWTNNAAGFRGTAYRCDFLNNAKATEYLSAYDCRFKGNSGNMGSGIDILSNCVFEANTGYMKCKTTATVIDCVFTNNTPTTAEGIIKDAGLFRRCEFVDNSRATSSGGACLCYKSSVSATVDGCKFLRNSFNLGSNSGACGIYMERTATVLSALTVTNCIFEGNVCTNSGYTYNSGCAIFVNATGLSDGENAWDYCTVYDSVFVTNSANDRAGVSGVHAKRCKFDRNRRIPPKWDDAHFGGDAASSFLEDCDLSGGDLSDCVVSRCKIHDISNGNYGAVFRNYTRATNCIIVGCSPPVGNNNQMFYHVYQYQRLDAEFVNCTIVSNKMDTFVASSNLSATNGLRFINCIFNGNTGTAAGTETDLDLWRSDDSEKWYWTNCVSFVSSYFGRFRPDSGRLSAEMFAATTNAPNSLMLCEDPKFAGKSESVMRRHPDEPYWALAVKSPLRDKGEDVGFTATDLDLAGRLRLRDGAVDVGCYECWLNPPGMMMTIK